MATIETKDVERLMKRCQIGVGGKNALNEAHGIMADCYGTLGALVQERDELRANHEGHGRTVKPHRSGGGMPAPAPLPPLPNCLAKDKSGVAFYDGIQMHQYAMSYAELSEESDTISAFDPVAMANKRAGEVLASKLDDELYQAIAVYLKSTEFGFAISEVRKRGRMVSKKGEPVEVFYMDSTPLLEIHPVEAIMNGNIITFTRNIKRLYGTEKANT